MEQTNTLPSQVRTKHSQLSDRLFDLEALQIKLVITGPLQMSSVILPVPVPQS
jgi:hypothetical protein